MIDRTPPVLKAWNRIFDLLKCIHDNPYNRGGFEESVLALYNSEYSKSVFRGMAIPTLRNLGFILGFGDNIRISANGNLVYDVDTIVNREEGLRALRAILVEFDEKIGVLAFLLQKSAYHIEELMKELSQEIVIDDTRTSNKPQSQQRAANERLRDWINFLGFSELLYNHGKNVLLDENHFNGAKQDLDTSVEVKQQLFDENLISCYRKIFVDQKGVSTVEIEELRKEMAIRLYQSREILTQNQFDKLFTEFPKVTETYIISLGRSMGADEKLFYFQGKYYQTLYIRFL